jgi:hypothetical protein
MSFPRVLIFGLLLAIAVADENSSKESRRLAFSLVRGTVAFMPVSPGTMAIDAPNVVLAFAGASRRVLVLADGIGDYTAVLEPGHYCVSAYNVKSGDRLQLDPKQTKCFEISRKRDMRVDVLLAKPAPY